MISQDGTDAHGMCYKAVLKTSPSTGVNIGHLRFPFKDGFSHMTGSTYSTIEIYGLPTSPSLVPKWHVSIEPPEGATSVQTLYGGSQGDDAYRPAHTNSDTHYENGRAHPKGRRRHQPRPRAHHPHHNE